MFQTTNQSYLWVNDMAVSENGADPPQRSGKICIFDRQLSAIDADIILNSPFAEGIQNGSSHHKDNNATKNDISS